MTQRFDKWWAQEREASYMSLRYPLLYCALINHIIRLISALFSDNSINSDKGLLVNTICVLAMTVCTLCVESCAPNYKHLCAILICEVNSAAFYYSANYLMPDHKEAFLIGSVVATMIFEISQIKAFWLTILFQVKFVYFWYLQKIVNQGVDLPDVPTPYMSCIFAIISVSVYEFHKRKRSFQMYLLTRREEETLQKLEAIISFVPEALLVISSEEKVVFHNQNSCEMLGGDVSADLEFTLKCLSYDDGRREYASINTDNKFITDLRNYINGGNTNTKTAFGVVKFHDKYLNIHGSKVLWENQLAVIITVRDLSVIIKLERSEADLKWKASMLRSVFHELKTPTTGITAFSIQVLEEETSLSESGKEKLRILVLCSKMLLNLISDLQDYSQIMSGTFTLNNKKFQLKPMVENALQLISLQCNKRHIECKLIYDKLLPDTIYSDKQRLSQVLSNLLSNALK